MADPRPGVGDPDRESPWPGETGAGRLYARVRDAGSRGHDLPTRLEAGLRAALAMLASDHDLAGLLTVDPHMGGGEGQEIALAAQRRWLRRFGRLLEDAAADDPRCAPGPLLRELFLIEGVRHRIARSVLAGEAGALPLLLPGLLEVLLAYYLEPGEPRRLARAGLDG